MIIVMNIIAAVSLATLDIIPKPSYGYYSFVLAAFGVASDN
jgi:hypothetical protein